MTSDYDDEKTDVFKEANQDVLEEIKKFQERKKMTEEELEEEEEEEQIEKKPQEKSKEKKVRDLTKLNEFKDKLVNDFGLKEKQNKRGRCSLLFNEKQVLRFIPRTRIWYAIKRKDPEMNNQVQYFKITSQEEEESHYKYVEDFVKSHPKEEANENTEA